MPGSVGIIRREQRGYCSSGESESASCGQPGPTQCRSHGQEWKLHYRVAPEGFRHRGRWHIGKDRDLRRGQRARPQSPGPG